MTAQQKIEVPEGCMQNAPWRLVPVDTIKDIDLSRNDFVIEYIEKAEEIQKTLRDFKMAALGDIGAFIDLSAERYHVNIGGKKGNVTLTSFDGRYRVQRAIAEKIAFDERIQAAQALIDQCKARWAEGSRNEVKVLIEDAFQVDKEGKISADRVLRLRRHKFDDPEWKQAMEAIADAIQVTGSKTYVRFYKRSGPDEKWEAISLDISKL